MAIESGHCRHLQELDLGGIIRIDQHEQGMSRIIIALQGGCCPDLMSLRLSGCRLSMDDGVNLGALLRSGVCPKLEKLYLGENPRLGGGRGSSPSSVIGSLPPSQ